MFTRKGIIKICSKFTGEHPFRIVISRQLLCNFMEIVLLHGCSLVNLLHILRTPLIKNTCARLLLNMLNVIQALHISLHKSATECSMLAEVNYVSLVTKCKLFLVAKGKCDKILSGWFVKTCEVIACFTGNL